jgi:hypothetical protein
MLQIHLRPLFVALAVLFLASSSAVSRADEAGAVRLVSHASTPVDVHPPESCENCDHETCIARRRIDDCLTGKVKCFKMKICKEYVSVPEVRYVWRMKCITKEIPCDSTKPVCKDEEVDNYYETEEWQKQPTECGDVHCKCCVPQTEKVNCKRCEFEPGKSTIKVRYWSCVKVPYTVYRQVAKDVCVKQPYYEKLKVPVTRYCCEHCDGAGCWLRKPKCCRSCDE